MRIFRLRPLFSAALLLCGGHAYAEQVFTNSTGIPLKVHVQQVCVQGGSVTLTVNPAGGEAKTRVAWQSTEAEESKAPAADPGAAFEGTYDKDQVFSTLVLNLAPGGTMVFTPTRDEGSIAARLEFFFKVAPDLPGSAHKSQGFIYKAASDPSGVFQDLLFDYVRPGTEVVTAYDGFILEPSDPYSPAHSLKKYADGCGCVIL